jgi:ketosteroid isomerase-like protein
MSPFAHPVTAESEIIELLDTLRQAHHDKNGAAIAALYAPNAAVFDLSPPLAHPGVSAKPKQAWLDSWETGISLDFHQLKITVSGDHAFAHGFQRMRGTKKGAEGAVDFWMRITFCFHRQSEGWRIVHEHESVPFYMDGTFRPAFDLEP